MVLAGRITGHDYFTYVVTGDGEIQEGIVWEAAMSARKYKAGRLIVFVDNNGIQSGGPVAEVSGLDPILPKWEAFGWHCQEIDGHDFGQILQAIENAKARDRAAVPDPGPYRSRGRASRSWSETIPGISECRPDRSTRRPCVPWEDPAHDQAGKHTYRLHRGPDGDRGARSQGWSWCVPTRFWWSRRSPLLRSIPDRFVDVGIAEQNAVACAAGHGGLRPGAVCGHLCGLHHDAGVRAGADLRGLSGPERQAGRGKRRHRPQANAKA